MLIRVDIDHPALLVNLDHAADDDVSNVRPVALPQWTHANDSIDLMHDTGH